MSIPKEGSRETDEGIIISEAMDWCRSPTAIVPYTIWARQREATDLAQSVRQTGDPSHVKGSVVLKCYGDEPGVGGGVASGTHGAKCTPKTWSATVRAEGRNMVRHDDEWWMNHKNTYGRLNYTKDMTSYATPQVASITPLMSPPSGGAASASRFSTDPALARRSRDTVRGGLTLVLSWRWRPKVFPRRRVASWPVYVMSCNQSVKQTADELKRLRKGDCEEELQKAVDKAFAGKNMDQLVRADPRSPSIFQGEMDWIMQPGGQTTRAPFDFLNQPQYETGR